MIFPVLMLAGIIPDLCGFDTSSASVYFLIFSEASGDSVTLNPSPCWRGTYLSVQHREALKK